MRQKPQTDKNFDSLAKRFQKNIYTSRKGQLRLETLWRDINQQIPELNQQPLNILDAGGGQGQFSLMLAAQGHKITLCDYSEAMLELAHQNFRDAGLESQITLLHSPIQELPHWLAGEQFDGILCHAVTEWLADPQETLSVLPEMIRSGGWLSLMAYNLDALIFFNIVRGNLDRVLAQQFRGTGKTLTPTNPQKPDTVLSWINQWGLTLKSQTGIRCFGDWLQGDWKESETELEKLQQIEQMYSQLEPFKNLARYIHFFASKP
ncbi:methyltransferase domain-containing protein [Pelagibaculum spongiae]|uniref:methyltransferase domain-containing protein n=1 Tax=Pelagibaculum spongiae TaxID=2080658 RepID=UPI001313FA5E|nr:methyltransferase domain-containing protein [Pelagibaculum spongiae]